MNIKCIKQSSYILTIGNASIELSDRELVELKSKITNTLAVNEGTSHLNKLTVFND